MNTILFCVFIIAAEPTQPFLVPNKMCDPPCQRLNLARWLRKPLGKLHWQSVDNILSCVVYS